MVKNILVMVAANTLPLPLLGVGVQYPSCEEQACVLFSATVAEHSYFVTA